MGGAVSSGRDNNELIDNLVGSNYIRSRRVELVFRALDRADYMLAECRDQAYKDLAWRSGPLHLSAPCIYSEVMEWLELKPGMSFLNIGSGTGYLSTLVGLMLGQGGVNHGVEISPSVVEYANRRLNDFLDRNIAVDEFEFCVPKFFLGNALCLTPLQAGYDRVYCGAGCPEEYQNYMKQLIKVGGILVMPLNDSLLQVKRESATTWSSRNVLSVSFATLREPTKAEKQDPVKLDDVCPPALGTLTRGAVRGSLRRRLLQQHGSLRAPPRPQRPKRREPHSICIPVDDDQHLDGLNELHDLDRAGGAHEMNALLSLVLSMGQNHVAGAIRFDPADTSSGSSDEEDAPPARDAPPSGEAPAGGDDEQPPRRRDLADVIRRAADGIGPEGRVTGRGRLSLTLEYNDPADVRGREDSEDSEDEEVESEDEDSDEERPGPRKRHSQAEGSDSREDTAEDSETPDSDAKDSSQAKRQKFDSGLGDESGPADDSGTRRSDEELDPYARPATPGPTERDRERADEDERPGNISETPESDAKDSSQAKRQKFDSGLGDESGPADESGTRSSDEELDLFSRSATPGPTERDRERADEDERPVRRIRSVVVSPRSPRSPRPPRPPRRRRRGRAPQDARRERLAQLLKDAIRELPLPRLYKRYLDFCRAADL